MGVSSPTLPALLCLPSSVVTASVCQCGLDSTGPTVGLKLFPGPFQPPASRASCCWWGLVFTMPCQFPSPCSHALHAAP